MPMSSTDPQVLDAIVKAYDVRGTVPDQFNPEIAHALGVGFARFAGARRILVAGRFDVPGIDGQLYAGCDALAVIDGVYVAGGSA